MFVINVGDIFGRLTVIEIISRSVVKCRCNCLNKTEKIFSNLANLRSGLTKSCGCLRKESSSRRKKNEIGNKYGMLTVIASAQPRINGAGQARSYWLCKCDCKEEVEVEVEAAMLRSGNTKSCGCNKIKFGINHPNYKHGLSQKNHPAFSKWGHMKERCRNMEDSNYGGKGITVEEPWFSDAKSFCDWYDLNCEGNYKLTIDRIDNNGNYSPVNCQLKTLKEQSNNKSTNHIIKVFGQALTIRQACNLPECQVKYPTLLFRISHGWDPEEAILTLPNVRRKSKGVDNRSPRQILYYCLRSLIGRCTNPNDKAYSQYGSRGIMVCEDWNSLSKLDNFYSWAMSNGWDKKLSIERLDVDGNYEPGNCIWGNSKTQGNNKTNSKFYTYEDFTGTLKQIWEKFNKGISYNRFWKRFKDGMDMKQALETPPKF